METRTLSTVELDERYADAHALAARLDALCDGVSTTVGLMACGILAGCLLRVKARNQQADVRRLTREWADHLCFVMGTDPFRRRLRWYWLLALNGLTWLLIGLVLGFTLSTLIR